MTGRQQLNFQAEQFQTLLFFYLMEKEMRDNSEASRAFLAA